MYIQVYSVVVTKPCLPEAKTGPGETMPNRLSMVVFSGTVNRLYPVAIMASGAVAILCKFSPTKPT
jgi:hypothetical protein